MQRATRSCFATSTVQECTTVLDCTSAGARREIDHDAPPQVRFFTKIDEIILNKKRFLIHPVEHDLINDGIAAVFKQKMDDIRHFFRHYHTFR